MACSILAISRTAEGSLPKLRNRMPVYRVIQGKGPEHQKTFTVEVRGGPGLSARGRGPSKKAAEQEATHALYLKFTKEQ